jgi:hypothetical protein
LTRLDTAVDRLVGQVAHWTPARWATPAKGGGTRAEVVHGLVQRLADLAAEAEGQPRRVVPRLDSDLALPDQLRVIAADLIAADPSPDVLNEATAAVTAARAAIS